MLQTELEAGKNLNDTLERENSKIHKKMKKLTIHDEKSKSRIESLESTIKMLNEKQEINENDLRVRRIEISLLKRDFVKFFQIHLNCYVTVKDKESMMTELNQEIRQLRDEVKDANHHKQVLEKQVLKLQEDLEYLTSKYETLRDAEMVRK